MYRSEPQAPSRWWPYALVIAMAAGAALGYAALTHIAWDDWYIALRSARNLTEGHGLVYNPGERVQSFTSPLGVLVPASLCWVLGPHADETVLWGYRLLGAGLFGGAAALMLAWARTCGWGLWPTVLLVGLVIVEPKSLSFAVSGMETPFVIFFLALAVYAMAGWLCRRWLVLGLAWAGLMWSRPDSFVYIGALGLGMLAFGSVPEAVGNRRAVAVLLLKAGLVCTVLYLPWFLWAWSYYGSPIPHTVIAKGVGAQPFDAQASLVTVLTYPWLSVAVPTAMDANYSPTYMGMGGWPGAVPLISRALSWMGALAWIVPGLDRRVRAVSLAALVVLVYLSVVVPFAFPWYLVPAALLTSVVLAGLMEEGTRRLAPVWRQRTAAALSVVLLAYLGTLTVFTVRTMRLQHLIVEEGVRKPMARWLAAQPHTPDEVVFVEALGYVGFYSNRRMIDYPGLCSPEVVAIHRETDRRSYAPYVRELRPEWVVLRAKEDRELRAEDPDLLDRDYALVKTFDATDQVKAIGFLPGRYFLLHDSAFHIYRRRDGGS